MIYDIYHKTEFVYTGMVTFSHNIARLKPKDSEYQKLISFDIEVEPEAFEIFEFKDIFENENSHILIRESHERLVVTGKSRVQIDKDAIEKSIKKAQKSTVTYENAIERLSSFHIDDLYAKQFLYESELIPKSSNGIKEYALKSYKPNRNLFEATTEFMERIFNDFEFVSGFSDVTTPIEEIFEAKKGVCQDFAQFAISALRTIGLPARYVSGYIETTPPDGKEKLFGVDASHAWFSVYIPEVGWVDFDPTNNIIPKDQHILLGYGRDYLDISPLKGVVLSSGASRLLVMVDVRRL